MKEIQKNCERITNVHFTKFCKLGPRSFALYSPCNATELAFQFSSVVLLRALIRYDMI